MLRWARGGCHKEESGTHYFKDLFLHPVRFVAHVVGLGAFRTQNAGALFYMFRWAQCRSHEKRARTHYAGRVVHSDASGA
jgi:hypothetical protein